MAFIRLVACFPANDQFDWCTAVRHRFNQQMLSFVVFNPADIRDGIADFLKMESFWIFDRWIKDLAFAHCKARSINRNIRGNGG